MSKNEVLALILQQNFRLFHVDLGAVCELFFSGFFFQVANLFAVPICLVEVFLTAVYLANRGVS